MTERDSRKLDKVVTYGPFFWTVGFAAISAAFGIGATYTSMMSAQSATNKQVEALENRVVRYEGMIQDIRERTIRTEEQTKAIREMLERR